MHHMLYFVSARSTLQNRTVSEFQTLVYKPGVAITTKLCLLHRMRNANLSVCGVQGWLVGDCLLSSSFLSYTGAFTYEYRKAMIYETWLKDVQVKSLPVSPEFRLEDLLTTEVETTMWASSGLPSDELSIQNGILTMKSSRYPLCIDPQMQAVTWIKRKCGKELDGRIKTFNDADFLKQLELAIQYGFPFLFENLDEYIDPVIDPVIEKNLSGTTRKIVKLGDKEVEWDDNFRLYLTTKLANPHYTPEVAGKTMIINYSVTQQGLSDQLLNVTVRHERPDLEEQREQLVIEMSDNKAALQELEDTLLYELSNASGVMLEPICCSLVRKLWAGKKGCLLYTSDAADE